MRKRRHSLGVRWGRGFAVVLLVAPALFAAPQQPATPRHENRHVIDQLEERWRGAVLSRNIAVLETLLADDYMAITAIGTLESKEEALANLRTGAMQFRSIELSDRKVRFYGTTAVVTSRAEVSGTTAATGDFSGSYRYTRVYVRDARGVWRAVSFEASRIRDIEASR